MQCLPQATCDLYPLTKTCRCQGCIFYLVMKRARCHMHVAYLLPWKVQDDIHSEVSGKMLSRCIFLTCCRQGLSLGQTGGSDQHPTTTPVIWGQIAGFRESERIT